MSFKHCQFTSDPNYFVKNSSLLQWAMKLPVKVRYIIIHLSRTLISTLELLVQCN